MHRIKSTEWSAHLFNFNFIWQEIARQELVFNCFVVQLTMGSNWKNGSFETVACVTCDVFWRGQKQNISVHWRLHFKEFENLYKFKWMFKGFLKKSNKTTISIIRVKTIFFSFLNAKLKHSFPTKFPSHRLLAKTFHVPH